MYSEKLRLIESGNGSASDMIYVGWCLVYGDEVVQDIGAGIAWLEKAAAIGSSEALVRLANLYETGDIEALDCDKVREYYRLAVERPDFFGSYALAISHYFGSRCFPRDLDLANKYFTQAGARGHLVSQAQSARLMRSGAFGGVARIKGFFLPIKIAFAASYLILGRKAEYQFWDANRWLPSSPWLQRLKKGTRFE